MEQEMNMKTFFCGLMMIALVVCAETLFLSCSLQEEYGTLIINLPGSGSPARAAEWKTDYNDEDYPFFEEFVDTLTFRIECNAPGITGRNVRYGSSVSIILPKGNWIVTVTARNAANQIVGTSENYSAAIETGKITPLDIEIEIEADGCELTDITLKIDGKSCSVIRSTEPDTFIVIMPRGIDGGTQVEFSGIHTGAVIQPHNGTWGLSSFDYGITVIPASGPDNKKVYTLELVEAYFISNAGEWAAALIDITAGGDGTPGEPIDYFIDVRNDITGVAPGSGSTFGYGQFINVIITGNGANAGLNLASNSYGFLLNIGNNQTVTMQNVALKGKGISVYNTAPLVYITSNGTFIMDSGEVSGNNTWGEGIVVDGGGVFVGNGGAFTMNSGRVSVNTATRGGGVFVNGSGAVFTMNGGEVSGNSAANYSVGGAGGVYQTGGGVFISDGGAFTMTGGEVSGNTISAIGIGAGGGVCVDYSGGAFTMTGGKVTGNTGSIGGGVYLVGSTDGVTITKGVLTMTGGEVSGNIGTWGAGVYIDGAGEFTMNDGKVSGNKAYGDGGGVQAALGGAFIMNGGEVSGNEAGLGGANAYGGGVYVTGAFTMNGGKVSGNKTNGPGGGVYVSNTFRMTNGVITGFGAADANRDGGYSSAALYRTVSSTAEYGIYTTGWELIGSFSEREDTTINIINGNRVP